MAENMKNQNENIQKLWAQSVKNNDRKNMCAVLFGGNFALTENQEFILFRKSHRSNAHKSDKTIILTANFLNKLSDKLETK